MALKGNLRDVSLNQLLNLIHLARKTGALTVQNDSGSRATRLFFREGKLIYALLDGHEQHLTDMMVKVGKITSDQAAAVKARSRVDTDKELGLLMIQNNILSQNDIVQGVKSYLLDSVYQLLTWPSGPFRFDANQLPPEERVVVPVGLEHVIMEGTRRAQEWEQLRDDLPDLDAPLKFSEKPDTNLRNINLNVDQWKVISFINSKNTMHQIADYLRLDEFQIRRIVAGLQTAGLVDVVPIERPKRVPAPMAPVGRGVVMRVMDRLRGM